MVYEVLEKGFIRGELVKGSMSFLEAPNWQGAIKWGPHANLAQGSKEPLVVVGSACKAVVAGSACPTVVGSACPVPLCAAMALLKNLQLKRGASSIMSSRRQAAPEVDEAHLEDKLANFVCLVGVEAAFDFGAYQGVRTCQAIKGPCLVRGLVLLRYLDGGSKQGGMREAFPQGLPQA